MYTYFIGLSPYSVIVSVLPFLFILCVTAIKEAYEDYLRHVEDKKQNSSLFLHLVKRVLPKIDHLPRMSMVDTEEPIDIKFADVSLDYKEYKSGAIMVGEILLIKENQQFPCDLLLIGSSETGGRAFIDTANLDGETK